MIPGWFKNLFDEQKIRCYYGKGRYCPVGGKSSSHFKQFGRVPREDAQCVHCQALERHRLLWLFLQSKTDLLDSKTKKMLHIAPHPCFESRCKELRRKHGRVLLV